MVRFFRGCRPDRRGGPNHWSGSHVLRRLSGRSAIASSPPRPSPARSERPTPGLATRARTATSTEGRVEAGLHPGSVAGDLCGPPGWSGPVSVAPGAERTSLGNARRSASSKAGSGEAAVTRTSRSEKVLDWGEASDTGAGAGRGGGGRRGRDLFRGPFRPHDRARSRVSARDQHGLAGDFGRFSGLLGGSCLEPSSSALALSISRCAAAL